MDEALALARSADCAIREGRLADARLLYARVLRLVRAAGYRRCAEACGLQIRYLLGLAGGLDRGRGEGDIKGSPPRSDHGTHY